MKPNPHNHRAVHLMYESKLAKRSSKFVLKWCLMSLFVLLNTMAGGLLADENENRRVDISLSIFPRIVAVDNHFRDKLSEDKEAYLLFVYDKDEEYAQQLSDRMKKGNANIGGMKVLAKIISVEDDLPKNYPPTALFLVEKLSDSQLEKIMLYSKEAHRLVFSPYSGDVERGATVGISVTNRVKPYFNLSTLRQSKVAINALLMKMSNRYE